MPDTPFLECSTITASTGDHIRTGTLPLVRSARSHWFDTTPFLEVTHGVSPNPPTPIPPHADDREGELRSCLTFSALAPSDPQTPGLPAPRGPAPRPAHPDRSP
jgi:hypothetical protein